MIIGISGKIGSGKDTMGMIIQALTMTHAGRWKQDPVGYLQAYAGRPNLKGGWEIRKFAGKLKQIVSLLTGIPVEDLEKQEVKDRVLGPDWDRYIQHRERRIVSANQPYPHIPLESMTVRKLLQEIGTEAMRDNIHPNVWVNALFADYKPLYEGETLARASGFSLKTGPILPNWIITDVRFPNEADAIIGKGGIVLRINRTARGVGISAHPSETALDNYDRFTEVIENNGTIEELVLKTKVVLQKHKLID